MSLISHSYESYSYRKTRIAYIQYAYTVDQENRYFVKNMLLLNIFTKSRNDWVKIVDYLIKAYFWQSIDSPGTQCTYEIEIYTRTLY